MSQVKGQEEYKGMTCLLLSLSCNQPSHLTSWGWTPFKVKNKEQNMIAMVVPPKMLPVTKRIALAGRMDCRTTAPKTPTVIITTTTGNPTTKKQTNYLDWILALYGTPFIFNDNKLLKPFFG